MATKFSFVINKELSKEQQKRIADVIGNSLLRSEDWYLEGQARCENFKNDGMANSYKESYQIAHLISYVIGACGENISIEEV